MDKGDKGFFAVGLDEWRVACDLGLTAACSFLVLACGTGRDNSTTSWAANAVQTYAGISWVRAKPAIDQLIGAALVQAVSKTKKPRYKLKIGTERIWLPKSIIVPLGGEIPALHRIRQAQDVMLLRLFVELYYAQNLAADGGLSREVYCRQFEKTVFTESSEFVFLGFDAESNCVTWSTDVTAAHRVEVSEAERRDGKNEGHVFFKRIQTLRDMGLLEYSVCILESTDKDAEILFPVHGPEEWEREMMEVGQDLAEQLLPDWQVDRCPHKYLVPVFRHQEQAQAFGIYRLRHRPHTALTAAWYATMKERVELMKSAFLRQS
ncbi:hypothetical protein [Castellaniella sp.]|uniref:hypothetical protein n=1 Tax=Castellaniella sp. TaxID=1955812 RepID=UPI003A8E81BC